MSDQQAATLVRESRRRAGLSQAQLAQRLGTTQSVVSAYESAARQPSLPMLSRLVAATGNELVVQLAADGARPATRQPLLATIRRHRDQLNRIAARHGLSNLRVFGSAARGDDTDASDIDLMVDVGPHVGLFAMARCRAEMETLLGTRVDLVPADDLKDRVARSATHDAQRV